jgi:hypothetical protein
MLSFSEKDIIHFMMQWSAQLQIPVYTTKYERRGKKCYRLRSDWKCVGLYRMSEYSGLIIVSRNTLGPQKTQLSGCTNSTVYAKQLIVFHLDKVQPRYNPLYDAMISTTPNTGIYNKVRETREKMLQTQIRLLRMIVIILIFISCTSLSLRYIHWNLSNPTHQGSREMCRIVQDVRIFRFNYS